MRTNTDFIRVSHIWIPCFRKCSLISDLPRNKLFGRNYQKVKNAVVKKMYETPTAIKDRDSLEDTSGDSHIRRALGAHRRKGATSKSTLAGRII